MGHALAPLYPHATELINMLSERHSGIQDRPDQLERELGPGLERRQREARRFLGKPSARNDGDGKVQKALL
jgi:hypothetical protein